MDLQEVLRQYLEGAITFSELMLRFAEHHVNAETEAMNAPKPHCATCGLLFGDKV